MSFWDNPWTVTVGGGAVLGLGGWLLKFVRGKKSREAREAVIAQPSGGTSIANTGTIGVVNIRTTAASPVPTAQQPGTRLREVMAMARVNVERTTRFVATAITEIETNNWLRGETVVALEECRDGSLRLEVRIAPADTIRLMPRIIGWQSDIAHIARETLEVQIGMSNMNLLPSQGPRESQEFPGRARLPDFYVLRDRGSLLLSEAIDHWR